MSNDCALIIVLLLFVFVCQPGGRVMLSPRLCISFAYCDDSLTRMNIMLSSGRVVEWPLIRKELLTQLKVCTFFSYMLFDNL